jgi:predicted dehydrogenase
MGHQYFVIGAGSIGRRHHGNLQSLGADVTLLPWRETDAAALAARIGAASKPAVVIATATPIRLELIALCASLGAPFYAEKPLAYRMETLERLYELAAPVAGRSVVGLMMRYHPAFMARAAAGTEAYGFDFAIGHDVRQWRQNWRFADSYAARADGGGVLLDLCHEIDMAACLFPGLAVTKVDCIGHRDFPGVDFATRVSLAAEGGPVGSVSMDYLSPKSTRRMRLSGREEVVDLDLLDCHELCFDAAGAHERRWSFERNDMFLGLMRDFMALAEGRETSGNPLLPRFDRMFDSAALIAAAWEAREFHGTIEGGFE